MKALRPFDSSGQAKLSVTGCGWFCVYAAQRLVCAGDNTQNGWKKPLFENRFYE